MRPALPLVEEITPTPDPVDALRRLAGWPFVLFLDSASPGEPRARYSYLMARPFRLLRARQRSVEVFMETDVDPSILGYATSTPSDADPFEAIRHQLEPLAGSCVPDLPPFQGGAAGLFGYDLARCIERLPSARFDEFEAPDLAVGLFDWVLAFDHERGTCHIIAHGFPHENAAKRLDAAATRVNAVKERLLGAPADDASFRPTEPLPPSALAPHWPVDGKDGLLSNFRHDDYIDAVARSIEYVHAGDIFQVNISQRLLYPQRVSPLEFYLRLRKTNPAPFAAYFDTGEHVIASSSPEQFLSVEGDEVVTRPIKGTRSRGYSVEEDMYRRDDLLKSEKDRSENVMIVDLLRNDLSRVCLPGTVTVPHLFDTERFSTVHHLVSEVRGRLRPGNNAVDLLRASFPGGSITGAPKVRAMEIIADLEPTARGAYCGSLGWIAFHGDMGSNLLIRTVTVARGWLQFPVGGGIVADSSPEAEYRETLDKAAGMVRALG